jgi:prephenate dehydrogenase
VPWAGKFSKKEHSVFNDATSCSVGILGLGLIGGSIAMALKAGDRKRRIVAVDNDDSTIAYALKRSIIDEGSRSHELLAGSDLVILATPAWHIREWLDTEGHALPEGTVIIDTGSSKRAIVNAMSKLPPSLQPVGGHPMAGKEISGIVAADENLFRGAPFFLTPLDRTPPSLLRELEHFVTLLGAHPMRVDAGTHDAMLAGSSHLPYLTAVSLVLSLESMIEKSLISRPFFSSGFRDTSRLAAGDVEMSMAMCTSNRDMVLRSMREFLSNAERLLTLLESGEDGKLKEMLQHARSLRSIIMPPRI